MLPWSQIGKGALRCFFNLSPKSPCQFTNVLLNSHGHTWTCRSPHFSVWSYLPVLGSYQEVPDGVASFKMYLYPNLSTYILEDFTKSLCVRNHGIGVTHFIVTVVINVVSVVVVFLPDYYYFYSCCWSEVCLRPKWDTCTRLCPSSTRSSCFFFLHR